ncbi:MAG TPA: glutaredoxin 3 [Burkholderiaceae bacterium]|nr:glutaredoxin 3 [Burkholderiaceae bacterium]
MAEPGQAEGGEPADVVMYATGTCPYCVRAEALLKARGVASIVKIRVDLQPERRAEMIERSGRRTVPQIYIGARHVGGYDDLAALDRAGGLVGLLQGRGPDRGAPDSVGE